MAADGTAKSDQGVLSWRTIFLHGSIGLPLAMFGYPIGVWLPPFYAGELGVSVATVGTIIMLARLTDVATDPLIGYASDHTRTRLGRRKPYMLLGLIPMAIGVVFLFMPQVLGVEEVGWWWLLVWLSVMFLGSTLIYIPYYAWGAEMSPDYHERSRITGVREVFVLGGLIVAAMIPALVEGGSRGNPAPVMLALGIAILVITPLLVLPVVSFIPESRHKIQRTIGFMQGLKLVARNGPMVRVLLIVLIVVGGEAFRNALSLFFMRDVVGIQEIGLLYLIYFATGLVAIPFWLWLGRQMGKHRAFAVCMVVVSLISAATFFVTRGMTTEFTVLFIAKGFCFGGLQFLPLSMLADVVDVDTARSRSNRAGTFFAINSLTAKLAIAFGTGISLNIVGRIGFVATGEIGANTPEVLTWLAFNYTIVPPLFFFAALWLVWNYPLTQARQARLRGLIERRNARLAEASPQTVGEHS